MLDEVPDKIVPTLVAHTVINAHIKFSEKHDDEWLRRMVKMMNELFKDNDEEIMFRTLITLEFGNHHFSPHTTDLDKYQKIRIRDMYVDSTGCTRIESLLAYRFIIEFLISKQKGE